MPPLLLVMFGGAVGSGARYLAGVAGLRLFGPGLPWGTLFVNVAGGLLMGLLAGILARSPGMAGEPTRLLLGVGVLGGFTTFSSFSLESFNMLGRGEAATAIVYALGSVILSVGALAAGTQIARVAA
ncbi:fluoride efflux transporter CrcB [Sphingomonas naphthae]|uniref:Fluoride-specific ion channel FluC n=1 Tax=Sphingomonas naphthae TaxID=1813468 RepID=A0ABY7TFA6_9SPHN|nr:fluoride efflux transporter CrcB [Sphingomonas naphthae]WCT71917.1 fluoride efflux transporter CrcB [Sphingomonas naphthae]